MTEALGVGVSVRGRLRQRGTDERRCQDWLQNCGRAELERVGSM